MDTKAVVITVVMVVLVAVALLLVAKAARRKRAERATGLRERFGPEYDRAVQQTGSERKAQAELGRVADTRDKLEIRPLDPTQRDRYESDWMSVQAAFVDAPEAAVRDADRLVGAAMRDRGYPVDDFDSRSDMVAVDHPGIAENYRAASAIRKRTEDGTGYDTDDLRQAFVHYRALFTELLSDDGAGRHAAMGDGQGRVDLTQRDRATQDPQQR